MHRDFNIRSPIPACMRATMPARKPASGAGCSPRMWGCRAARIAPEQMLGWHEEERASVHVHAPLFAAITKGCTPLSKLEAMDVDPAAAGHLRVEYLLVGNLPSVLQCIMSAAASTSL